MKKIAYGICAVCFLYGTSSAAMSGEGSFDSSSNRTTNIKAYVPGLFAGWVGGAVDIKVNPAVTVGPTAKYFAYGNNSGYSLGVNMNYALSGDIFSEGWIINPYVGYYKTNFDLNESQRKSTGIFGTHLMYQWIWPNGINTQLGVGLVYSTLKLPMSIGNTNISPNFDFSIGYAF